MSSGKSVVADFLTKNCDFRELSFAAKLKEITSDLFGVQGKDPIERSILQQVGMHMREVDPSVWVRYVVRQVPLHKHVVISDVRYPNEFATLKGLGFVMVRMVMSAEEQARLLQQHYPGLPQILTEDYSETALDDFKFDHYIYNEKENTIQDVYDQAARLIDGLVKRGD
jgi:hypothetical protein